MADLAWMRPTAIISLVLARPGASSNSLTSIYNRHQSFQADLQGWVGDAVFGARAHAQHADMQYNTIHTYLHTLYIHGIADGE